MKLYLVFGIMYHEGRDLLGIYDNLKQALERAEKEDALTYECCRIEAHLLNSDINHENWNRDKI